MSKHTFFFLKTNFYIDTPKFIYFIIIDKNEKTIEV